MRCTSVQMGYALGRIEDMGPKLSPTDYLQFDQLPDYAGHLASIATHAKFRGQGVAKALMERMHFNMAEFYGMDKVNLLCRVRQHVTYSAILAITNQHIILRATSGVKQGGYFVVSRPTRLRLRPHGVPVLPRRRGRPSDGTNGPPGPATNHDRRAATRTEASERSQRCFNRSRSFRK
jgi:hypothetical protein